MNADFLDRLAGQLKIDKSAACRRTIERMHAVLKSNYEGGKYKSQTEAELDFMRLLNEQRACGKPKPVAKTILHQGAKSK